MKTQEELDKMSEQEICKLIDQNKEVMAKMVGALYPSILYDQNSQYISYLSSKRKYSYAGGKFYTEMQYRRYR